MCKLTFVGAPAQRRTRVLSPKKNGGGAGVDLVFWTSRGARGPVETLFVEAKTANGRKPDSREPTRDGFAKLAKKFTPPEEWFAEPDVF